MKSDFLRNILGDKGVGDGGFYFGDTTSPADADIVIVSAPWSVTSDYGRGATYTPDAVIDASAEKNLYDTVADVSVAGRVATAEIDYNIQESSEHLGREAERIAHQYLGENGFVGEYVAKKVAHINEGFSEMQVSIYKQTKHWASQGKRIAVVGGDHSVAFGAVKALAEVNDGLGVLFIDAHADFLRSGEEFNYSHRSIARNIVEEVSSIERLVELFLAEKLAAKRFEGESWGNICREVVGKLPQKVYVSLDIDALKIEFCGNTNAPVPGGMTFDEVVYLINTVVESGREIVGFDISEVVSSINNKMDAIVATQLLAKMCVAMLRK